MILEKAYKNRMVLFLLCLGLSFFAGGAPALADDTAYSYTATDFSIVIVEHNPDSDPWKGWFNLTVTNNTGIAWGDFHFELGDIAGWPSSGVVFCDSTNPLCQDPTSSQSGLTWTISNSGKNLDLYFYSDPVYNNQTATFSIYTDNTANQQPFSITMYPTVVPEPVSSALFIIGGATIGIRHFRKRRKRS